MPGRLLALALVAALGLFVAIQLVPYGRDHDNPPVRAEPAWDSPQTRQLTARACFDCHSNETAWPWYSNIAPTSWMMQRDVEEGREELNFSEWDGEQEGEDAVETIENGGMPPWYYLPMHPEANLSSSERAALLSGLATTLGVDLVGEGERDEDGDDGEDENDDGDKDEENGRADDGDENEGDEDDDDDERERHR